MGNYFSLLLSSIVCIFVSYIYSKRARRSYQLPAPDFVWLIGHSYKMAKNFHRLYDYALELSRAAGEENCVDVGLMQLFDRPHRFILLGANEKLFEHVLKINFLSYIKGEFFYDRAVDMLGDGIFNIDGDAWRYHRKIASYMFTARHLKDDMTKIFLSNGEIVKKKFIHYAETGKIFDIQDIFFRYTFDSFTFIAFGENPNCLSLDDMPLFAKAFDIVQAATHNRFFSPAWRLRVLFKWGEEKNFQESLKIMNDYAYSVIKRRKEMNNNNNNNKSSELQDKTDLLTRFIVYSQNKQKLDGEETEGEGGEKDNNNNNPNNTESLSDKEMRDIVLNFIIAGRDTTACLLSWSIYELTQHPEYFSLLYNDINIKYNETNNYESCALLDNIQYYLYETLRLHPSVPLDMKTCINNDILPDGTKVLKNDIIMYSPYIIGRSKLLWGDDSELFNPDRWKNNKSISEYKFPHFNAGPRLCLGKRVAILEAGLLLSIIIHSFIIELEGQSKLNGVTYLPSLTLPIKNGLFVKIYKREQYLKTKQQQQ